MALPKLQQLSLKAVLVVVAGIVVASVGTLSLKYDVSFNKFFAFCDPENGCTLTHYVCRNSACQEVSGAGMDRCATDADCVLAPAPPPAGQPPSALPGTSCGSLGGTACTGRFSGGCDAGYVDVGQKTSDCDSGRGYCCKPAPSSGGPAPTPKPKIKFAPTGPSTTKTCAEVMGSCCAKDPASNVNCAKSGLALLEVTNDCAWGCFGAAAVAPGGVTCASAGGSFCKARQSEPCATGFPQGYVDVGIRTLDCDGGFGFCCKPAGAPSAPSPTPPIPVYSGLPSASIVPKVYDLSIEGAYVKCTSKLLNKYCATGNDYVVTSGRWFTLQWNGSGYSCSAGASPALDGVWSGTLPSFSGTRTFGLNFPSGGQQKLSLSCWNGVTFPAKDSKSDSKTIKVYVVPQQQPGGGY